MQNNFEINAILSVKYLIKNTKGPKIYLINMLIVLEIILIAYIWIHIFILRA